MSLTPHEIRFFVECYVDEDENGVNIEDVEITEEDFTRLNKSLAYRTYYSRSTVFDNGCKQVCLTLEPIHEREHIDDLDLEELK